MDSENKRPVLPPIPASPWPQRDELHKMAGDWKKSPFQLDLDKTLDVLLGLQKGDINDCQAKAVNHVSELLNIIICSKFMKSDVFDQAIGFYPDIWLEYQERLAEERGKLFSSWLGFGEEFTVALQAQNEPQQAGLIAAFVNLVMKAKDLNQNQAIKVVAQATGRDEENIRRSVTRAKTRKQPKQ
jgi:hypothetical protein